jgi:hypothetical protein
VPARFAAEAKSLAEVEDELAKLARNFQKLGVPEEGVSVGASGGVAVFFALPPEELTSLGLRFLTLAPSLPHPSLAHAEVAGPAVAYVDDAESVKAQLMEFLPSLQHVIADVTDSIYR